MYVRSAAEGGNEIFCSQYLHCVAWLSPADAIFMKKNVIINTCTFHWKTIFVFLPFLFPSRSFMHLPIEIFYYLYFFSLFLTFLHSFIFVIFGLQMHILINKLCYVFMSTDVILCFVVVCYCLVPREKFNILYEFIFSFLNN